MKKALQPFRLRPAKSILAKAAAKAMRIAISASNSAGYGALPDHSGLPLPNRIDPVS